MAVKAFIPGQRWISESEPELGLGSILRISDRTVTVAFGASEETRDYAREHAPLRRAAFRVGDTIQDQQGRSRTVQHVDEQEGLFHYGGTENEQHWECCETELSWTISFSKPQERLRSGQHDPSEAFALRLAALRHQFRQRKAPARGFLGGRIDLIPHQLAIASEVASRVAPRVLLADEVGLGKTIEAGLILQRLIATGRAQRVLILLPDSLVHQWFVELLRRFNQWFHIFDEERCQALEEATPGSNPFLDDQRVICPLSLLTQNPTRLEQALEAGWDLLIVDEAHHLGWSPENPSPEYTAVEALGRVVPGMLLLTATPEQLGMASHFARLRLLDPERFFDLEAFLAEAGQYQDVARIAARLMDGGKLTKAEIAKLAALLNEPQAKVSQRLDLIQKGEAEGGRDTLLASLLDLHGTSRVIFRNTRASIPGFPARKAQLACLEGCEATLKALTKEWASDIEGTPSKRATLQDDPRIAWLADLLREMPSEKVLLICRSQAKAESIEAALKQQLRISMGVFHEGLSLVQRDRGAAWFADPEGARLLICSEIGSEGRNFQFAHHLVLFDLPLDPSLLEQRIGRLDRIGQRAEIQIHVPFVAGSPQEALVRWYHEGLNAFQENLPGGRELLEQFESNLRSLAPKLAKPTKASEKALKELLEASRSARQELKTRLEQGRDRLLELNSLRPELSSQLIQDIRQTDEDPALETFLLRLMDHLLVEVQEIGPRTYRLGSAGVLVESLPGLPEDGLAFTCDRARALEREDVQFMSWDHPFVTGALDLLLGSEKGNAAVAIWPDLETTGLYLEALLVLECVAPPRLHADRFLPPTPMRVLVDHKGEDLSTQLPPGTLAKRLKAGQVPALLERPEIREEWVPKLVRKAYGLAHRHVAKIIAKARFDMAAALEPEIARLLELQRVNRSVRPEEIEGLQQQRQALDEHLAGARLRLDAIRLIHRGK